jgi:hypothetical protein
MRSKIMTDIAGLTAAYLYALSLDGPGLAWEYLRRNGGYLADWRRHGQARTSAAVARAGRRAEPWGLRFPRGPDPRRPLGGAALAP